MTAFFFYYVVMIIFLVAMKDENAGELLNSFVKRMKNSPWLLLFMVVPIFFVPFMDVNIDQMMRYLGTRVGHYFVNNFDFSSLF